MTRAAVRHLRFIVGFTADVTYNILYRHWGCADWDSLCGSRARELDWEHKNLRALMANHRFVTRLLKEKSAEMANARTAWTAVDGLRLYYRAQRYNVLLAEVGGVSMPVCFDLVPRLAVDLKCDESAALCHARVQSTMVGLGCDPRLILSVPGTAAVLHQFMHA